MSEDILKPILAAIQAVPWSTMDRATIRKHSDEIRKVLEGIEVDEVHTVCAVCGKPADWLWWADPEDDSLCPDRAFCDLHLPKGGWATAILVRNGRGPGWEQFVMEAIKSERGKEGKR